MAWGVYRLALAAALTLSGLAQAGPVEQRDVSSSSVAGSRATAALLETTISGKLTTVPVGVPTAASTPSTTRSTSSSAVVAGSGDDSSEAIATGAPYVDPSSNSTNSDLLCQAEVVGPFCLPANDTKVYVGQNYWVTWNPNVFPINSTVTVVLNYANNSNIAAWTSEGMPREKGFTFVTMDNSWLIGASDRNLSFMMISYSASTNHVARPLAGPFVTLTKPGMPPPPKSKAPDLHSLAIGLPVALGGMLLIVLTLIFGMRKHRTIGLGSVMGRRRGYGERKSRRERMGLKKGAIRLQERELAPSPEQGDHVTPASGPRHYRDDSDPLPYPGGRQPAQQQQQQFGGQHDEKAGWGGEAPQIQISRHGREESLGSLVDEEPNAFRREMQNQRSQR